MACMCRVRRAAGEALDVAAVAAVVRGASTTLEAIRSVHGRPTSTAGGRSGPEVRAGNHSMPHIRLEDADVAALERTLRSCTVLARLECVTPFDAPRHRLLNARLGRRERVHTAYRGTMSATRARWRSRAPSAVARACALSGTSVAHLVPEAPGRPVSLRAATTCFHRFASNCVRNAGARALAAALAHLPLLEELEYGHGGRGSRHAHKPLPKFPNCASLRAPAAHQLGQQSDRRRGRVRAGRRHPRARAPDVPLVRSLLPPVAHVPNA